MSEPRVFVAYSHDDSEWVRDFAEALSTQDVYVWFDEWRIPAGASMRDALEEGLRESDAIVAVLSPRNATRPTVLFEVGVALGLGKPLIPVVSPDLSGSAIPFDMRARRYLVRGAPGDTAREVAAALKAFPAVGSQATPEAV